MQHARYVLHSCTQGNSIWKRDSPTTHTHSGGFPSIQQPRQSYCMTMLPSIWKFQANGQISLFFLSGQNFWVEKKGCVWRKLDIWQLYLRLLSFSVTKYEIECKYSEFLIFKQKPFFHFIILYGVSFLLSRLDSDEEEAINWRNSFCCHCKWN